MVAVFVVLAAAIGFSWGRSALPIEAEIQTILGSQDFRVGAPLRNWIQHLGEPETINQKDRGTTFFYWPESGIAVFCHPLFKGQARTSPKQDWVVTDILLPRTTIIRPYISPVSEEVKIHFSNILPLRIELQRDDMNFRTRVRTYFEANVLQAIRIQKRDSLLGDYN